MRTGGELEVDHEVGDAGVHDGLPQSPRQLHCALCHCIRDHPIHACRPLPAGTASKAVRECYEQLTRGKYQVCRPPVRKFRMKCLTC